MTVLAGTASGLHRVGGEGELEGRNVTSLAVQDAESWWAILDGRTVASSHDGAWEEVGTVEGFQATCLEPTWPGVLVGTSDAHLLRLRDGSLERVESFEQAPGRADWYTPWGGPPDVRSISRALDGTVYVNVHVGGILRSTEDDEWQPTLDIDADVHQVLWDFRSEAVFAATARGLAITRDRGATWDFRTDGLHGPYCRAVTGTSETILVSASTGPFAKQGAVYRTELDGTLERCRGGLPEWFPGNVDTFSLASRGSVAAIGTSDGNVFLSEDSARTWRLAAEGLPAINCVAVV